MIKFVLNLFGVKKIYNFSCEFCGKRYETEHESFVCEDWDIIFNNGKNVPEEKGNASLPNSCD